jgi:hypothetical protein
VLRGTTKVIKEKHKVDIKTLLKTSVAAGALMALAAPMTLAPVSSAEAGDVASTNSKVKTTFGGRLHRSVQHVDDGQHDGIFQSDGISANSEIWFSGTAALTESVTMGAYMRWDIAKNAGTTSFDGVDGDEATTSPAFTSKNEYITFSHKSMGKLTIGDHAEASNGAPNQRYAALLYGEGSAGAGFEFTTGANGAWSGTTVGAVWDDTDPGTGNIIRYDSPSFGGFGLALSTAQAGGQSMKISYAGTISGLSVKGAIGHVNEEAGGNDGTSTNGSIAVKHTSGLNAHFGYGRTDENETTIDAQYETYGIGYAGKFNSFGQTDLYVVHHETKDAAVDGGEADEITVGINQALDAVGGRIGMAYSQVSYDDGLGTDFNDIDVVYFETGFNF